LVLRQKKQNVMQNETVVIVVALGISIATHAIVVPMVSSEHSLAHSPTTKATHLETPPLDVDNIELGIDESKESTLTWIGYEEYEEQWARFAQVEQAEMHFEPETTPSPTSIETLRVITEPLTDLAKELAKLMQEFSIEFPSGKTEPPKSKNLAKSEQPEQLIEQAPTEIAETKPQYPKSNAADRDSDATSIMHISPEQWKSGKPLAGEGIVLRPRRPSFTANQSVSNVVGNLAADLIIDKTGKPINVEILVSTGSYSIDRTIESSLYRWRASGENIEALKSDDTIRITIYIMFH
jgi:hypothetical protein